MSQSLVIHAWSFGSARLLWPAGTQQCELWTPIDSYNSAGQVSKFRWFGQLAPKTWNFNLFIMAHSTSDLIFGLQFQRSRPCTASMDFDPWWFTPYGSTIRPTQHFAVENTKFVKHACTCRCSMFIYHLQTLLGYGRKPSRCCLHTLYLNGILLAIAFNMVTIHAYDLRLEHPCRYRSQTNWMVDIANKSKWSHLWVFQLDINEKYRTMSCSYQYQRHTHTHTHIYIYNNNKCK